MKRMKLSIPFFCLLFGIFCQTYPYLAEIIIWEKDGRKVIGCGDVHDYYQFAANFSQWHFLHENLSRLDRKCCVLVEDIKAYEGSDPLVKEFVEKWPQSSPQNGLVSTVDNYGIKAINLEYRYARDAALIPFVDTNKDTPFKASDVVKEFDAVVDSVLAYDDEVCLTKMYREKIGAVRDNNASILSQMRNFPGALTQWIRSYVPSEKQSLFAKRMRVWDAPLLDLVATHVIAQYHDTEKILIFAGAMHINAIGQALVDHQGFKRSGSSESDMVMPYSESSLSFDTLPRCEDPERLLSRFTPLPVEQLKVIFE